VITSAPPESPAASAMCPASRPIVSRTTRRPCNAAVSLSIDIDVQSNYAYIADGSCGLSIFDIRKPSNPIYKAGVDTDGFSWNVVVSGNHAYVADDSNGLVVINVKDVTSPYQYSHVDTGSRVMDLVMFQNYIYLAVGNSGLQIVKLCDI